MLQQMVSGPVGAERLGGKQQPEKRRVWRVLGGSGDQVRMGGWEFGWVLSAGEDLSRDRKILGRTNEKRANKQGEGAWELAAAGEHGCRAKSSQADGWREQNATRPDRQQKEDPAQTKHGEDRSKQEGKKKKKNKREIWHLPKCHPIKPAAQSGERGNSRDPQAGVPLL